MPFEDLARHLASVDIVITSTGSQEPIIRARDIRSVLKARRNRPMFFIDIAVPRDVDPDVNGLDNVYLYDIDDLKEVVEENLSGRREEASKARQIVDEEVAAFAGWVGRLDVQPTIKELIHRSRLAEEEEVARTMRRLGRTDDATREALEAMAQGLMKKFLHEPLSYLKEGDRAEHSRRILAIQNIFNLDRHCASRFNAYEDRENALRHARAEADAKASRSRPATAGDAEGKLCSADMDGLAGQEG